MNKYSPANISGDPLVRVVFRDHVLFRHVDASQVEIVRRECVGWIHDQDEDSIAIVFERLLDPMPLVDRGIVDPQVRPYEKGLMPSGMVLARALVDTIEEVHLG